MALNPFFLQGSPGEQNLVQDLVNEHLKMFGIEVYYIPRKYIDTDNIIKEVRSSKFDSNFIIEAYLNNYEGYGANYDIMSKFGLKLTSEITLTISKERFEEFITPFLQDILSATEADSTLDDGSTLFFANRPKEGDLIYFPLGERIFEIKRVEFENPFYQLGKNYVYDLKCELFELEDELIDTDIEEIQDTVKDVGYITTLILVGAGITATATATRASSGVVGQIYLNNDGSNYTSSPTITFDAPPVGGLRATAVAITTDSIRSKSISTIQLTNCGFGYTSAPNITISGGGGAGAAATASIVNNGVYTIGLTNAGTNYYTIPTVTISPPVGSGKTATAIATISNGVVSGFRITNAGSGYVSNPTVTISSPSPTGIGTFKNNEEIVGSISGTRAFIKSWANQSGEKVLKVSINTGRFYPGETVIGVASSAIYSVKSFQAYDLYDPYAENLQIEAAADQILDFSESNPFGNY
jgi:hypothetical protein